MLDAFLNVFFPIDIVAHHDQKTILKKILRHPHGMRSAVQIPLFDVTYFPSLEFLSEAIFNHFLKVTNNQNDLINLLR